NSKVLSNTNEELSKLNIGDRTSYDAPQEQSKEDPQIEEVEPSNKPQELPKAWKFVRNHPIDQIIGDPSRKVSTRSNLRDGCNHIAFVSQIEPKNFNEAENDESWIIAMQEELNQFERNKVWELVPRPHNHSIIGTKWVFRNKKDENGNVIRNKARLVAQGYNQQEGIDYDET
ncbi:hypothetical protein DVA67_036110, partial [Solirubrobacter sp. CPCC 204708]|nr:hypothetical protein [Solirubrobacter deserti]